MGDTILIYGATGYTGRLIARRAFALDDAATLDAGLAGARVVLHCAGPFAHTSRPMADACLRTGTHYLDITGEIEVFEALAARSSEAAAAGVMLLPGVGFDVVPSDCVAAHLRERLPSATHLALAFQALGGGLSRGAAGVSDPGRALRSRFHVGVRGSRAGRSPLACQWAGAVLPLCRPTPCLFYSRAVIVVPQTAASTERTMASSASQEARISACFTSSAAC